MKSILTLIKLEQRKLDDLRRHLKSLQDEEAMLIAKKEELAQNLITEQKKAVNDLNAAQTFPAYQKFTKQSIASLGDLIITTRQRADKVREEIALSFGELKKLEIYRDVKTAETEEKSAKIEQKMMDEMGLRKFSLRSEP